MSTCQNPEARTRQVKHLAPGPHPSILLLSPICAITASERLSCSAPLPGTGMWTSILAWDLFHPQLFSRSLSWLPCQSLPVSSYRDSPPPSKPPDNQSPGPVPARHVLSGLPPAWAPAPFPGPAAVSTMRPTVGLRPLVSP